MKVLVWILVFIITYLLTMLIGWGFWRLFSWIINRIVDDLHEGKLL